MFVRVYVCMSLNQWGVNNGRIAGILLSNVIIFNEFYG